ncbi:hypothetical protein [Streptomyces orinoci]|uniref:Uncharacterized protein n=1 Tax=Streptomyces orinoci TaxID=67339 RepID=A0ABV3K0U5_STRON|nr:hypothetical protein [Streptomyces orinoci]
MSSMQTRPDTDIEVELRGDIPVAAAAGRSLPRASRRCTGTRRGR